MTYALWIVQGLLALLFLFTGGIKLVLPWRKRTRSKLYYVLVVLVRIYSQRFLTVV